MKLVPVLTTAVLAAGSVAATTPATAAELTTFCVGAFEGITIPGDLVVRPGESCSLTDTTVTGNTYVRDGADLLLTGGTMTGSVLVRHDAFLDSLGGTQFLGHVLNRGFGVFGEDAHFGAGVRTRAIDEAILPFTTLENSHVVGTVDSAGGDVLLDGTVVDGAVEVTGGDVADAFDSVVLGALSVTGTGSTAVCESEVHGDAAFTGSTTGLHLGTTGALPDCVGPAVWLGDVAVNGSTGGVELNGNVVLGDLSGEGNDPAPVGAGNRVRGEVSGQFVDLAPAAVAAAPEASTAMTAVAGARVDRLSAPVEERRTAATADAAAAEPLLSH